MHELYENAVRFAETDAEGVVFYGNYATYQDETFAAYLDEIGFPYDERVARGWHFRIVNLELNYRASATFGDRLTNALRVRSIGDSSLESDYECRNAEGELLVEGSVTHVLVDESGEPSPVPEALRSAIVDFQAEPPETA